MRTLTSPSRSDDASVGRRTWFYRHARLLWLSVFWYGCTEFPSIPADVCGNGVLDPGEDCDNANSTTCYPAGASNECRFDCHTHPCPDGYGCGVDGVCRRPSGRFTRRELAFGLDVVTAVVGDFDADEREDLLLGTLDSKTLVKFDDTREPLANKVSLPRGEMSVGDFDQDGRDDVCTWSWYDPVLQLYQARGSNDFVPVTNLFEAPSGTKTHAESYRWITANDADEAFPPLLLVDRTLYELDGMDSGSLHRLFNLDLHAKNVTGHIAVGTMDESASRSCQQFAMAGVGSTGVEVYSTCNNGRFETVHIDSTSSFFSPTVFLGNVDSDAHLDLILEDEDNTYVGYGVGDGTFHSSRATLPARSGDQVLTLMFHEGGLLDVGDLDGDALSDFVTTWSAVFSKPNSDAFACGERYCQWLSAFGHSGAKILEMTGDGISDIVAVYGSSPNVGLEFLLGLGNARFRSFPVQTEGTPVALRGEKVPIIAGDFDGDRRLDIVFPERRLLKGTSQVTATVLYGQALSPPREQHNLGALGVLQDFVTAELSLPKDGRTDLVTLSDTQKSRAIGIFEGDPGRAMQSPIRLTAEAMTARVMTCSAGRFEKSTQTDAVATSDRYDTFEPSNFETQLHLIPGSIKGPTRALVSTTKLGSNYVIASATLEISEELLDELLLLRAVGTSNDPSKLSALVLQEFAFSDGQGRPTTTATLRSNFSLDSQLYNVRLTTNDINADHNLDAIVFETTSEGSRFYVFFGDGKPALLNRAPLVLDAPNWGAKDSSYSPNESSWLNIDADPELELALIYATLGPEENEIWHIAFYDVNVIDGRLEPIADEQYSASQYSPRLLSGDFDGDGVTDIAVADSVTSIFFSEPVHP